MLIDSIKLNEIAFKTELHSLPCYQPFPQQSLQTQQSGGCGWRGWRLAGLGHEGTVLFLKMSEI